MTDRADEIERMMLDGPLATGMIVEDGDLSAMIRAYGDERAEQTADDISFLLSLVPGWAKDVPPGLDPTFYGTGSEAGDWNVKRRVAAIRALKEKS